ncbi:hypothetical protein KTQ42_05405|uniref:hypothetical protein n=1 Tax=Noviherbaspirillum sp. L7-7A TaxID=2850560 RepID=UPI001C2C6EC4|nr:hypothetical protein [Noviherbaspirillum sp. L7-7A]MBV0878740.1 hypothetical protein [Noviherbaspirillum sp. L7-7A]
MASDGEQKRLEDAAGPHGARTTELVGVDDIGLPSGIQPEDVKDMPQAGSVAAMGGDSGGGGNPAGGSGGSASGGGSHGGHAGAPSPQQVGAGEGLSPGDEAAPGTVGSGDDVCPVCAGSGKNASGGACPNCRGTGIITEGIGGG